MAHILREVDRANKILQGFGVLEQRWCKYRLIFDQSSGMKSAFASNLRNFVEMMSRLLIHQDWEVECFDGVQRLVDLVEAVLGLSDVIEWGCQLLQALNLLLHLVIIGLSLNAIHCNNKVELMIEFLSQSPGYARVLIRSTVLVTSLQLCFESCPRSYTGPLIVLMLSMLFII